MFDDGAREHGDYDTAVTTLRSGSGAVVTIINSRHSASGYDQRLEAFGAEGQVSVDNAHLSLVSRSSSTATSMRSPHQSFFLDRYASAYRAELADFVGLIRGEASHASTFEDGRAALILADAALASAAGAGTVAVNLS
ncbi:putative dehydrogenase [Microbacterium testaceum]|nr:putative dehydrogenase [Microbacterium sp. SORGH_AS_0969]MDQ1115180.1 putative dehydrogenase [Microbacterium testaceum]